MADSLMTSESMVVGGEYEMDGMALLDIDEVFLEALGAMPVEDKQEIPSFKDNDFISVVLGAHIVVLLQHLILHIQPDHRSIEAIQQRVSQLRVFR